MEDLTQKMANPSEKKQESVTTPLESGGMEPPRAPAAGVKTSHASLQTPPFETWGKFIHNEATYRGVDWLLNSAVGVSVAYWAGRTQHGKDHFGTPVGRFFKQVLSPFLTSESSLAEGAKWGTTLTSISAGGLAITPLMVGLECRPIKKASIRWMDEAIYGKEVVENDPRFAQSYAAIDQEPRKDFSLGMASRYVALVPFLVFASVPKLNQQGIRFLYDPIARLTKSAAKLVGIRPGTMALEGALEHINGDPATPKQFMSNWDFLHRTIGFDFGLTLLYSYVHEPIYKAFSCRWGRQENGASICQNESPAPAAIALDRVTHAVPEAIISEARAVKNAAEAVEKTAQRFTHHKDLTTAQPHLRFTEYAAHPSSSTHAQPSV